MQRQFCSGSRQAPDPFDRFLEENNYYRKHTARDSSCLFRVISEQMYDTQLHHLIIRSRCVRYMRKHKALFQPLVDRDFDEYLDDMSKPKTFGTLVELQAVSYVFQHSVLLFQPFDLGTYFGRNTHFSEVFRVFYTPERHFDSVFTCEYIKDAAICQSICYEILYKDLYKLPDVFFAVEQMLHSNSFDHGECRFERDDNGYCTRIHLPDGRSFELNLPQDTCCILENHKLCHFHYANFMHDQEDIPAYANRSGQYRRNTYCRAFESVLPNKYISCVRQLLEEGITPFPYKVAKALDPSMYRNIEFDSWNEARKELKMQNWYKGDNNFKVGAKCHVRLHKSENDLYTCHIQDISVDKGHCVVFIEELGEKRLVPYEALKPLPPEQFKPWSLPYRLQRHMQKHNSFRCTRQYNYHFKYNGRFSQHSYSSLPADKSQYYGMEATDDVKCSYPPMSHHQRSCFYNLKQYTHLENFRAQTLEYCTMPLTVERNNNGGRDTDSKTPRSIENSSRAPSRSSVQTNEGQQVKQEPEDAMTNTSMTPLDQYEGESGNYIQEMPSYVYPVHQYGGGAEEYYGYGYDGNMMPTLLPTNSGGTVYYPSYLAPPPPPSGGNLYVPAAPPHVPPPPPPTNYIAAAGPSANATANFYPNAYYSAGMMPPSSSLLATSSHLNTPITTQNLTPSTRHGCGVDMTTPLTGRINWDAKKSTTPNATDLPTDMPTLRYFYNLGLEYYSKYLKQPLRGPGAAYDGGNDAKDDVGKIMSQFQHLRFDENGNIQESKCDTNSNNVTSVTNATSTSNKSAYSSQSRRFSSRYFNGKERQTCQQRGCGGNASSGNQNRGSDNTECNRNQSAGKWLPSSGSFSGASNSRYQMQNTNSCTNTGMASGINSLRAVSEQGIQTSPMVSSATDNNQAAQSLYNPFFTCGGYDYSGDQGGSSNYPPPAGGVLIQMPVVPSPYGIYAAPPPAPNLGMHPAAAGYASFMAVSPTAMQLHGVPPPPNAPLAAPQPSIQQAQANSGLYTAGFPTPAAPDGGVDNSAIAMGTVDGNGGVHFQCMSYPPPVPIYYSSATAIACGNAGGGTGAAPGCGVASSNGNTPNTSQMEMQSTGAGVMTGPQPNSGCQQTYWCVPPPTSQPSAQPNNGSTGASGGGGGQTAITPTGGAAMSKRRDKTTNE